MANIVSKKGKQGGVRGWEVRTKIPTADGKPYTFYASATTFKRSDVETVKTLLTDCEIDILKTGTIQPFALGRLETFPFIIDDFTKKGIIDAAPYTTLGDAVENALESLEQTAKEQTVTAARNQLRPLLEYFKPETSILKITRRDAQAFNSYLIKKVEAGEMAQTSKHGVISRTKWLFKRFIEQSEEPLTNPFQSIQGGSSTSEKEPRSITEEEAARIEVAIMNHETTGFYNSIEWLTYFRLGYWQGLRLGSEAPELKWEFIDFEKKILTIKDVKRTKRGKATQWREMPLFYQTAQALAQLKRERKRNGDALNYVFSDWWRYDRTKNGATSYNRITAILYDAGLEIDRPRQVLRQTASNRIRDEYGEYWENIWIGHTKDVARSAYYSKEIPQDILDKIAGMEPVATK